MVPRDVPPSSAERLAAQSHEHFVRLAPVVTVAAIYLMWRGCSER